MKIIHREFLKTETLTCHASTIVFHGDSPDPIFSWFGGIREGEPDSSIYLYRNGTMEVIGDKDGMPRWNPILFSHEDQLFLFVKAGIFCDRWQTFIYDITDPKDKFDKVQILPAGLNGPVKTKPIVRGNQIWMGSSVETFMDWTSYIEVYGLSNGKFLFESRSAPLTAEKIVKTDYYGRKKLTNGIIQPSLWEDYEGNMHAFFRSSKGLGKIYHSKNSGNRNQWTEPVATKFKNPNSGVDTVCFDDRLFLVYNPDRLLRYPLDIVELDWDTFEVKDKITIREEVDKNDGTLTRELSYPYMVEKDGKLHLVYTFGRSEIEYVIIE